MEQPVLSFLLDSYLIITRPDGVLTLILLFERDLNGIGIGNSGGFKKISVQSVFP